MRPPLLFSLPSARNGFQLYFGTTWTRYQYGSIHNHSLQIRRPNFVHIEVSGYIRSLVELLVKITSFYFHDMSTFSIREHGYAIERLFMR